MSEPDASRAGSILRAEREALGVTVREVAETLNLSMAVIEALEADDYARLPGLVFARGYVRAYARLLELEPDPLIAQYPRPQPVALLSRPSRESPIREWIRRRPGLVLGLAAAAGALLLVLLVTWMWPESSPQSGPDAVSADEPAASGMPPEQTAGQRSNEPGSLATVNGYPVTDAGSGGASGSAAAPTETRVGTLIDTSEVVAGVAAPGGAQAGAASGETRRITAGGDDNLSFTFSDDCWVEVRDADGRRLYSNLNRADTRLQLLGQAPFRILLGYAPGAQLSFNGEGVPLAPHTRDNVATLVLGQ